MKVYIIKKLLFTLSFAIALSVLGNSSAVMAADSAQEAYASFQQTAIAIDRQLYAKQAELDSLMANNQGTSPRVQELFKEMGELQGQLFAARAALGDTLNKSGNSAYAGRGRFPRGGMGFGGCCSGGYGGGYGGCGWW